MPKRFIRLVCLACISALSLTLASAEPAARNTQAPKALRPLAKAAASSGPTQVGVYDEGRWRLDFDGSGDFSFVGDRDFGLGFPGAQQFVADWNGDGFDEVGVFSNGFWFLDFDGNGAWDGGNKDLLLAFGWAGATPVVGDWNGDGTDDLGLYSNGFWFLDYDGSRSWDGGVADRLFPFGWEGAQPLIGDWNGDGADSVGVYSNGFWFLDYDGDALWDGGTVDRVFGWGWPGVQLVIGDWDGDGRDQAGVYSNGFWFLDQDGDTLWDGGVTDRIIPLGWPGARPVVGDWNGSGSDKAGVFSSGNWFLDRNGSGVWESEFDSIYGFGDEGEIPVVGRWSRSSVSGSIEMDPPPGTTNVPRDRSVILTLPYAVDPSTVHDQSVQLLLDGSLVATSTRVSADGRFVSIRGTQLLGASSEYEVRAAGLATSLGQVIEGEFSARFSTGTGTGNGRVQPWSPQARNGVPTNIQTLEVNFFEPLDPTSFQADGHYFTSAGTGRRVDLACELSSNWMRITCAVDEVLGVGSIHTLFGPGLSTVYSHDLTRPEAPLLSLTTAFLPDTGAPRVVQFRPPNGSGAVPVDASLEIVLDDVVAIAADGIELRRGGEVLPISVSESHAATGEGTTLAVHTPGHRLEELSTYTLEVSGIRNLAGNAMAGSARSTFTTAGPGQGGGSVVISPTVLGATLPRNVSFEISFDAAISAASWSPDKVRIEGPYTSSFAPIRASLSADRRKILVEAIGVFDANAQYEIRLGPDLFDENGRHFAGGRYGTFSTGDEVDEENPEIVGVVPPANATNVPLNPFFRVRFTEKLLWPPRAENAVRIRTAGGADVDVEVTGTFGHSAVARDLTVRPAALAPNSAYRLEIAGLTDLAGNPAPAYSAAFQTGTWTAGYGERPRLTSVSPAPGSTLGSVDAVLSAYFDQPVYPLPKESGPVFLDGDPVSAPVDLSMHSEGTEMRASPSEPLLPGGRYRLSFGDLNRVEIFGYGGGVAWSNGSSHVFRVPGSLPADTTAPRVISVSPGEGELIEIETGHVRIPVEVTFSEPISADSVTFESVLAAIDGQALATFSPYLSADARTVIVSIRLSSGHSAFTAEKDTAEIALIVTNQVADVFGNRLDSDFVVKFLAQQRRRDLSGLELHEVRPSRSAENVPASSSIDLVMTTAFGTDNLDEAFYIAEDGRLIEGSFEALAQDQVVRFTPNRPFAPRSVVQIFSRDVLRTPGGELEIQWHWDSDSSFTVEGPPPDELAIEAISPRLSDYSARQSMPSNSVFTVRFNDALDPGTVTASSVDIYDFTLATVVPSSLRILPSGDTVELTPLEPLASGPSYQLRVTTAVRGQAGGALVQEKIWGFDVTSGLDEETPSVFAVSPPPGREEVPLNARVRVRFSEEMDLNTIRADSFVLEANGVPVPPHELTYDGLATGALLLPLETLRPNTTYSARISGARDLAGRAAAPASWSFTTGASIDTTDPFLDNRLTSPSVLPAGQPFGMSYSEPMDPASIDPSRVRFAANGTDEVAASVHFDEGGRILVFTPAQPLAVGKQYSVHFDSQLKDLAGNGRYSSSPRFVAGFTPDSAGPEVLSSSIEDGSVDVSPFLEVRLEMNEPVDVRTLTQENVRILMGSAPQPVLIKLENNRTTVLLQSATPLALDTDYRIELRNLADLGGNAMLIPYSADFRTLATFDMTPPRYVTNVASARDLYRNVTPKLRFTESLDPSTVRPDTVYLSVEGAVHPGTPTLDASGKIVTVVPDEPLPSDSGVAVVVTDGLTDAEGNPFEEQSPTFFSRFTTNSELTDQTAPFVTSFLPMDGATNVLRSAVVMYQLNESLDPWALPSVVFRVQEPGGSTIVGYPLDANTTYQYELSGGADFAGNPLTPFQGSFTTGSVTDNTSDPSATSSSPAPESTDVRLDPTITVEFDQPVSITHVWLQREQVYGPIPIRWTLSPDFRQLTIEPLAPLDISVRHVVTFDGSNSVGRRINANGGVGRSFRFTTTSTPFEPDPDPPMVLSVDPPDGAVDVADPTVTLTFSEPIRDSTRTGIGLFLDGASHAASIGLVGDGSTVVVNSGSISELSGQFTVVVSEAVKDLAGNSSVPFLSRFTYTDPDMTAEGATQNTVTRPVSGASGVAVDSAVHFFFNGALDPTTAPGSVLVSEDGALITGSASLQGNNQVLTFEPDLPYTHGSTIEAFLDLGSLFAPDGGPTGNHVSRTRFTAASDGIPSGPLRVVAEIRSGSLVPLDAQFLFRFNKPVDAATLDADSVIVNFGGSVQPATISLAEDGFLLRVVPAGLIPAESFGWIRLTGSILAEDGESFSGGSYHQLYLTSSSAAAGALPSVLISPPNGAVDVGVNAEIVLRFSDRINRATVGESTVSWTNSASGVGVPCTFIYSTDEDYDVITVVPHDPFDPASDYTISVDGVEDLAGRALPVTAVTFTASEAPDFVRPGMVRFTPEEFGSPRNTAVVLQFDEVIDPNTVNGASMRLLDQNVPYPGNEVQGSISIEEDSRTIVFLPDALLEGGHSYQLVVDKAIEDLAGNAALFSPHERRHFTVDDRIESGPPSVDTWLPSENATDAALNSRVSIVFNRPVRPSSIDPTQVRIEQGGGVVPSVLNVGGAGKAIVLRPIRLFDPLTTYTWRAESVRDLAGTEMVGTVVGSFTTGSSADLTPPILLSSTPEDNATGVSRSASLELVFDEPLSPDTVLDGSFVFTVNGNVAATFVTLSPDGRTVTATLAHTPPALARISAWISSDWSDLSGNPFVGHVSYEVGE